MFAVLVLGVFLIDSVKLTSLMETDVGMCSLVNKKSSDIAQNVVAAVKIELAICCLLLAPPETKAVHFQLMFLRSLVKQNTKLTRIDID
jgi:hypothetical protein